MSPGRPSDPVPGAGHPPGPAADHARERRIKALALTTPIFDLQASRGRREGDWLRFDLAELCLAAIDHVVDRMGFDSGASREYLEGALIEEASRFAPDAPRDHLESVANVVIETLVRPMTTEYSAADRRRHRYDYSLLVELESPEGVYLRATTQAINFLVSAIDTDIESAQAAAEAQLENLIRRRRLPEAEAVARTARIRSIQYAEEVRRIIAETRRDIRRAGWDDRIPLRLREMLEHLEERMAVETKLAGAMRVTRDDAEREDLRIQAARLVETVEDCLTRHMDLHARLMEADRTFFEEHDRQAFAPMLSLRAFDLTDEFLRPLTAASLAEAGPALAAFAERVWGVRQPRIGRYGAVVTALLRPPLTNDGLGAPVPDIEWADPVDDPRVFSVAAVDAAESVLADLDEPARLSAVLAEARRRGGADAADYLRLRALAATAPPLVQIRRGSEPLLAAADDGRTLEDSVFWGADLLVGWLEPDDDALSVRDLHANGDAAEDAQGLTKLRFAARLPAPNGPGAQP